MAIPKPNTFKVHLCLAGAILAAFAGSALADSEGVRSLKEAPAPMSMDKFTFVRIQYDSVGGWGEAYYDYDGRRWFRWETDYPEADENFIFRMGELTTSGPNPSAIVHRLTDEEIFRYPFVYMCDVGWMDLSPKEAERLGEYLNRGGFLWADDFWGQAEWDNFEFNMNMALPDLQWKEIPKDHPILSIVFPLESCPQVPARDFAEGGWQWDPPGIHRQPAGGEAGVNKVGFRGWFDDDGRLMAVATFNTDIGDGFEREGYDQWYFENFSIQSYAMGINIVVYALTH